MVSGRVVVVVAFGARHFGLKFNKKTPGRIVDFSPKKNKQKFPTFFLKALNLLGW